MQPFGQVLSHLLSAFLPALCFKLLENENIQFRRWWLLRMVQTVVAIFNILSMSRLLVRVTNMQALARDQVRRYSEGHGFGKASGPHTIYLTLTLIALTWSEQLRYLTSSTNELFFKFVSFNHFENLTTVWTIRSSHHHISVFFHKHSSAGNRQQ